MAIPRNTSRANDPTTKYCNDVLAGRIVAGRLVRLACERHLRDLKDGAKRGLHFDVAAAAWVIQFFAEVLPLPEVGTAFVLSAWERFVVGSLFGWKNDDGSRRFRTAYIEVGKGNGKSPLAGGLGIYMMAADGEAQAQCFAAATMREQADILFQDAVKMVQASPFLRDHIRTSGAMKVFNLAHVDSGSFFRPVSSEHKGLDGKRVHYAALDELHEHQSSIVADKMRAGTKGRKQALILEITNSGFDRNSVCWNHHEYSDKILRGIVKNDSWFAYVCGLDLCDECSTTGTAQQGCEKCDDWRDERVWLKANPNLGISISKKYLREQVAEAVGMPSKENIVKRLNFCMWTSQNERWMPMEKWDACTLPVDVDALRGCPCFAGLDLASTTDIAALCLLFPPYMEREHWAALWRFWLPAEAVRLRSERDRVPYEQWVREGLITTTPGNVTDYDAIRREISGVYFADDKKLVDDDALVNQFNIRELAFDRWNATQLVTQLEGDGVTMVAFGQGFQSMSAPTKELLKLVVSRAFAHGGNAVARFMASNVAVRQDPAGNLKPDKEKSKEKIDGVVALLEALGRAIVQPVVVESIYESHGIEAF